MKPYFSFQWHITDDCDQRCKHCYIFAESQQKCIDSMTRGEMETVLKNCEDFCETFGRRPYFYLTGGRSHPAPGFLVAAGKIQGKADTLYHYGESLSSDGECMQTHEGLRLRALSDVP